MINKTGDGIDFNPNEVTLANIFKMNLLQFAYVINEITNAAIKELNMKNEIKAYKRSSSSTEERCSILHGIDGILDILNECKTKLL